jgi:hypothetical protein
MAKFPSAPFLTRDFSPSGGGIDFLGMRWVNLTLLAEYLIPGINNATSDVGMYCLAAWIPWKFHYLCADKSEFRLSKYQAFQEAVEVMMSYAMRSGSPSSEKYGNVNRGVGVQQKLTLPSVPSFAGASRKRSNSIFAAPLYGPSLRYLGLIAGDALAADGTSTQIPLTSEDKDTEVVVATVQAALEACRHFSKIDCLTPPSISAKEIDDLGMQGLNPAYYRDMPRKVKRAVISKLLPKEDANGRTLTAQLLIATIRQRSGLTLDGIRSVWHSGLLPNGRELRMPNPDLAIQRERWSIFQGRQYQRWAIEQLMWCFEFALTQGFGLIDDMVAYALSDYQASDGYPGSLNDCVQAEARQVSRATKYETISEHWTRDVHGEHPAYIGNLRADKEMEECESAIRTLARWWIQTLGCLGWEQHKPLLTLGGEDRISASWFFNWIKARLESPLEKLVKDIFEQLVFAQHIRVALSRFDGQNQRLRFVLGDGGIVPTRSAIDKLAGNQLPGWTADRLWSFSRLLCDVDVIAEDDKGGLDLGELAEEAV